MRHIFCRLMSLVALCGLLPLAIAAGDNPLPDAIVVGPASITYHARAGDTLLTIAQQLTTKPENWVALAKINHISQDSNIPIGTPIVIPADLLIDDPSQAQVVALSGKVTAVGTDGQAILMRVGAKLTEGAQIETGVNGFLTMSLSDASRISVPSNSQVKFSKLRVTRYTKSPRTELMLLRGHVESRVAPLEINKGSYEVHTPTAVAGVRGTQFRVGVDGDNVTNEVLTGQVAVGKAKQTPGLTLNAGEGNVINAKGVGPAVTLLPAPQLEGLSSKPTAQIRLVPVTGAIAYHVQLANDPDAQDVLAEGHSNDAKVKFVGLPEGTYYARVSAIDKNGLEGLARIQSVSFAGNASVSVETGTAKNNAPFVAGFDDKQVTLRWPAQPGKEYIVQVARDNQFSWLIFNGNVNEPEAHLPRPPFGTYFARVQAVNADGNSGTFSPSQTFIVTDHWVINDGGPVSAKNAASVKAPSKGN